MATVFSTLCLQVQNCVFCQTGTEGISSVPHSEMDAVCQAHLPSQLNPPLSCCSCPHRAASAGAGLQRLPRALQGLTLYAWLCCSLIAVPKYQMSEYDWSPAPPLPDFRCITEFPKSLHGKHDRPFLQRVLQREGICQRVDSGLISWNCCGSRFHYCKKWDLLLLCACKGRRVH